MDGVLESPAQVRCCLERFLDLYQPATTSLLQIGAFLNGAGTTEIFHPGFIDELDERTELGRRLRCLEDRDRTILMLWHVAGLPPGEVARRVGVSRRQHRRRLRVTPFRCPCAARSGAEPGAPHGATRRRQERSCSTSTSTPSPVGHPHPSTAGASSDAAPSMPRARRLRCSPASVRPPRPSPESQTARAC